MTRFERLLLAAVLACAPWLVHAQGFKCRQADGSTSYQDHACPADASSTRGPAIVRYNDGLLYVGTNNRILVWQGVPTFSNAPASFVLGQSSTTVDLPNPGGMSARTLNAPFGLAFANDRLYIADVENDRIIARPLPE